MKKRVREEAQSITANCNIKIFGKLEDPTETKDFFEKTVGSAIVTEVSGFQMAGGTEFGSYFDTQQAGVQLRPRASYDGLRAFTEGEAVVTFGETVTDCKIFYANPGFAKAMRVTRFMSLPQPDEQLMKHASAITALRDLMIDKTWTAERADVALETSEEIAALNQGFDLADNPETNKVDAGIAAIVQVHAINNTIEDTVPPPKAATPEPSVETKEAPPSPLAKKPEISEPEVKAEPEEKKAAPPAGGPMGFFSGGGKKNEDEPNTSKKPEVAPEPPPASKETPPEQKTDEPIKLPKEIKDIIDTAGAKAKKELFKDKDEN
mgnify:FL=1